MDEDLLSEKAQNLSFTFLRDSEQITEPVSEFSEGWFSTIPLIS